jgi:hypothetical protein
MASLVVVHDNPRAVIASWDNVIVNIWRRDVDAPDVATIAPLQQELIRKYGCFASLAVAGPGALQMSSAARDEAARIAKLGEGRNRGIAVVVARGGFGGAAIRAVVTAVHLLSRSRTPQRAFASLTDGADFVHQQLGAPAGWNPTELAAAVSPLVGE